MCACLFHCLSEQCIWNLYLIWAWTHLSHACDDSFPSEESLPLFGVIMTQTLLVLLARSRYWWSFLNLRKHKEKSPHFVPSKIYNDDSSHNMHHILVAYGRPLLSHIYDKLGVIKADVWRTDNGAITNWALPQQPSSCHSPSCWRRTEELFQAYQEVWGNLPIITNVSCCRCKEIYLPE